MHLDLPKMLFCICLFLGGIGIIKNALEMSREMTFFPFSFIKILSIVVKDVCCGNSKTSLSSLKSRHILYNFDIFCSPV